MRAAPPVFVDLFVQHTRHAPQDNLGSAALTRAWTSPCSAAARCPRTASRSAAPASSSTPFSCSAPAT
eukprot:11527148-Alexandrium_andersonii.AAC.1